MKWKNSFHVEWPNLLVESDSEKSKTQKVQMDAIIGILDSILPSLDPSNKARIIQASLDNVNTLKLLFPTPFEIDIDALENYIPPIPEQTQGNEKDV